MELTEVSFRDFIMAQFGLSNAELDAGTPLFSSGILDSFDLVGLIGFIEREAGIRVSPSEVSLDNFDSIDRLRAFVQQRTTA